MWISSCVIKAFYCWQQEKRKRVNERVGKDEEDKEDEEEVEGTSTCMDLGCVIVSMARQLSWRKDEITSISWRSYSRRPIRPLCDIA